MEGLNRLDFKAALLIFRAAKLYLQTERAKLIVQIHDESAARAAFKERKGEEAEEGFTTSIEIAQAELRELEQNFGKVKAALVERWGDVFE
ncbi:MAG TPA: hypothetical protein VGB98_14155 [Pyrinomonadaceae bacterium]|jgi:hypothetical protein